MKKNPSRFLIAVIAFYGGVTLPTWNQVKTAFSADHYSKDLPYSVLEGSTVWIKPYNASFIIPQDWTMPSTGPGAQKKLYLSRKDLTELYWNDGEDYEDAHVINAVLPFADCAAHVGDKDWGNYFWNDIQARVYIVDATPEEVEKKVSTHGLTEASNSFEGASVIKANHGEWRNLTLEVMDAPTHFMLMKHLSFFYRRFSNKTVVAVFVQAGGFEPTVHGILDSFEWP